MILSEFEQRLKQILSQRMSTVWLWLVSDLRGSV
jgi:hypothetical protein